jgi:hypothetical protein
MRSYTQTATNIDPLIRIQCGALGLAQIEPDFGIFILTPFGDEELDVDPNYDDPEAGFTKLVAGLDDAPCGQVGLVMYNETSLLLIVADCGTQSVKYFVASLEDDCLCCSSFHELVLTYDPIATALV